MFQKGILLFFALLLSNLAQSQEQSDRESRLYLTTGLGISHFRFNNRVFNQRIHGKYYRFPSLNLRIGFVYEKNLTERLSLTTGLRLGLRVRRSTIYGHLRQPSGVPAMDEPFTFWELDDLNMQRKDYLVEVPLGIQWKLKDVDWGVSGIARTFYTYYHLDYGLLFSARFPVNKQINLRAEYYVAVPWAFNADLTVHNDFGQQIIYRVKNRFGQITLEYRL